MKKKVEDICRLCLKKTTMSEEHIPPYSIQKCIQETTNLRNRDLYTGYIKQGGLRGYLLCKECNNRAGKYLVPALLKWVKMILPYNPAKYNKCLIRDKLNLLNSEDKHNLYRQIVLMTLCISGPGVTKQHPPLKEFVKCGTSLPKKYELEIGLYNSDELIKGFIISQGCFCQIDSRLNIIKTSLGSLCFSPFWCGVDLVKLI